MIVKAFREYLKYYSVTVNDDNPYISYAYLTNYDFTTSMFVYMHLKFMEYYNYDIYSLHNLKFENIFIYENV